MAKISEVYFTLSTYLNSFTYVLEMWLIGLYNKLYLFYGFIYYSQWDNYLTLSSILVRRLTRYTNYVKGRSKHICISSNKISNIPLCVWVLIDFVRTVSYVIFLNKMDYNSEW